MTKKSKCFTGDKNKIQNAFKSDKKYVKNDGKKNLKYKAIKTLKLNKPS